ncbi:putative UDP-glucuronate:xylan alpha-glucuronosyltransferase 3 [Glycine max]|nr:putative UDP-glucuronate:xylan alpha-glucuronosyltransferase 3 [Glycine max]
MTICDTYVTLLYSPKVYNNNHLSSSSSRPNFVNRWIWGGLDRGYISNVDINWGDILQITAKLTGKKEFQEVGLLNFNNNELDHWEQLIPNVTHVVLELEYAAKNVTWESLYPEWIDEEEETEVLVCPSLPSLRSPGIRLNLIAVKLPHANGGNWSRDVARLHLQLAVARLTTSFKGNYPLEAYATILHSAHVYVCGAIAAAQSIHMSGSTRDLVILVDETISEYHRSGLEAVGWKFRTIQRIRKSVKFPYVVKSDAAHERWRKVHDAMPELLQQFCMLKSKQKAQLE